MPAFQGDAEDRKKLRAADKAKIKEINVERDIDQRLMEAEEMATMGLTCAAPAAMYMTSAIPLHAKVGVELPNSQASD